MDCICTSIGIRIGIRIRIRIRIRVGICICVRVRVRVGITLRTIRGTHAARVVAIKQSIAVVVGAIAAFSSGITLVVVHGAFVRVGIVVARLVAR